MPPRSQTVDPADPGPSDAFLSFDSEAAPPATPPAPAGAAVPQSRRFRQLARPLLMTAGTVPAAVVLALAAIGMESLLRTPGLPPVSGGPSPNDRPAELVISAFPGRSVVVVNGVGYGDTPVRLSLPPGSHVLQLEGDTHRRDVPVLVAAGETHYIDLGWPDPAVPIGPASSPSVLATRAGLVSFQSPIGLEVRAGNRVVGTTWSRPLRLAVGTHTLELVNASLEFRTTVSLDVRSASVQTVVVAVPSGALTVTAVPWAEVTVDGRPVGRTPLGNLAVPIGTHEVVWRHPELGERRQNVVVKAQTAARIGMDLSR